MLISSTLNDIFQVTVTLNLMPLETLILR